MFSYFLSIKIGKVFLGNVDVVTFVGYWYLSNLALFIKELVQKV